MWLLVLVSMLGVTGTMVALMVGEARVFGYKPRMMLSRAWIWMLTTLTQESEWLEGHLASSL